MGTPYRTSRSTRDYQENIALTYVNVDMQPLRGSRLPSISLPNLLLAGTLRIPARGKAGLLGHGSPSGYLDVPQKRNPDEVLFPWMLL